MLIIVLATVPVALVTFVLGAGNALSQIGKGPFAVEFDSDLPPRVTDEEPAEPSQAREDEIRQMLEAKAYRQHVRGETPLDVDAELGRLLEDGPPPNLSSTASWWRRCASL